jgi:hypothetical protein
MTVQSQLFFTAVQYSNFNNTWVEFTVTPANTKNKLYEKMLPADSNIVAADNNEVKLRQHCNTFYTYMFINFVSHRLQATIPVSE